MCPIWSRGGVIVTSLCLALLGGAALAQGPSTSSGQTTSTSSGQAYPNRPIRLMLPFPAGSPSDILGRALGQKLSEQLGENVVPDNRSGAGGNLGISLAAKSPPDGYTILLTSPTIAISPSLYAHLNYDAARDLVAVARLALIQNVLVVHPSVPATTLKAFISLARAHPGKLNFGSGGAGTTNHLANELLKNLTKINIVHVPFKGANEAMLALIGGQVEEVIVAVAPALPQIRAGRVRPLMVLSEQRVRTLPEVPTAKEAGLDNFVVSIWYVMLAPTRTPPDIIVRLNREITKALEAPELRERLIASGIDPWPGTPEQSASLVRSETARYASIIKSLGLRLD